MHMVQDNLDVVSGLNEIERRTRKIEAAQEIRDPHIRLAVLTGQLGQMARQLTHDQVLHPHALALPEKETEAAADLLIQTLLYFANRKLSVIDAYELGEQRMRERVFAKTQDTLFRETIFGGEVKALLLVLNEKDIEDLRMVIKTAKDYAPNLAFPVIAMRNSYMWTQIADLQSFIGGLIFGSGGTTSHPAIRAREDKIPSIITSDPIEWDLINKLDGQHVHFDTEKNPCVRK